jgi:hypothetical protein
MSEEKCSCKCPFLPLGILSLAVFIFFGLQLTLAVLDRDGLHEMKGQQDRPYAEGQKLQAQLGALVTGTFKLASQGNKNLEPIVLKLKEMGVSTEPQAPAGGAAAPSAALVPPVDKK